MTVKTGAARPDASKPEREATPHQTDRRREDLGVRYGAIGIASVAAAVRYAGDSKNQAYAPVVHRTEARFTEVAAA